jgi:plasmid stability protein
MKTTLDLPDDLVKQLKLRAVHEGKKLKDAVAETLRAGLAARKTRPKRGGAGAGGRGQAVVRKDRLTGLPVVQCRRAAAPGEELTPERVAEILAAQEAGWARGAG